MEKRTPSPSTNSTSNGTEKVATSTKADGNVKHLDVDTSGVDERKLIKKIDMALIPWLSLLYLLSFLDRQVSGSELHVLLICR